MATGGAHATLASAGARTRERAGVSPGVGCLGKGIRPRLADQAVAQAGGCASMTCHEGIAYVSGAEYLDRT